ncbi:MAG: aconitate hydratase [Spirochaetales bacterium]|nr:aconitate hydratase [Spirochaetales bacterium]
MGLTLTEKILKAHLVSGSVKPGDELSVKIDQTLTQDATGTMVYLQFEAMGLKRVRTELSVSYVDHNTLQNDFRNMDDHRYLQSAARRFGIYFSRPGNGICHQVHLERFGKPGKTLLGSDSHTPTGGGLGMLAVGAGGLDVAAALAGEPFSLNMPQVVGVKLTGSLKPMCAAKDVILTILQQETVKGGVGKVYEYFGPGVATLSVPERATITNMGAELGATSSIFPSDEITKRFLTLQKREQDWSEQHADSDAHYDRIIELDLGKIVPMAARPHMPDRVVPISEIEGLIIDQIAIGSCTNSSINDLGIAADILGGKHIPETVSLGISPGSRQVLLSADRAGILSKLITAGARILESACGPCIGMGFAPCSGGISVRTFNRNFKGRSGTGDAAVYLVSPETAAAAALHGKLVDPRKLALTKRDYSEFTEIDDSMIIAPAKENTAAEIIRGPNIKPLPLASPPPDSIQAEVLIKTGDNITTDHIMPAGAKILPLRSNIPEIAKHVFEQVDTEFYNRANKAKAGIVVGGENYGQGSSREHAAIAPMFLKVKAVIAKSFARIHKANLINFGILPLELQNTDDYEQLAVGDQLTLSAVPENLKSGNPIPVRNNTKNRDFFVTCDLSPRFKQIILAGGRLNEIKNR